MKEALHLGLLAVKLHFEFLSTDYDFISMKNTLLSHNFHKVKIFITKYSQYKLILLCYFSYIEYTVNEIYKFKTLSLIPTQS